MEIITKAKTPKEARDEIVKLIRYNAAQEHERAKATKHKGSKDHYIHAASIYEGLADLIDSIKDGA